MSGVSTTPGAENVIQVAPDSTGQKLRNLKVTYLDPATGLQVTANMEVVVVADSFGNIIDEFVDRGWQHEVLTELRAIRILLAEIADEDARVVLAAAEQI